LYPSLLKICSRLSEPAIMRDPVFSGFRREMLEELKLTGKLLE